ncbi:MAG: hypothetical protein FWF52_04520, partial [Candidatus Azobacteroides sp.]|nr:hypothetical protein [Candidatus Azobacteroides sp.]
MAIKSKSCITSSKGEFEEFHDGADIVEIGSVLFDTKTNEVVGFVSEEQETADVPSANAAMSIDPLCEKYYWITPYAYCLNNPVRYIDPRKKDIVDANGRIMYRNGQWLSNATEGAKLIASSMHLTPIGQESFNELANANYGVQLVYDQTSDIGKVGQ